ncbi:MAG: fatty acid cis/trans isomerase, partial [Haliea sp.]|nr:fatty acid cis/trans isomerase [Haliea sp.]
YTLLHDAGYSNIAQLFGEDKRRLPKEDAVTVVAGLIGAHPNLFFQVHEKQIPLFVSDILALHNTESLALLQQRYGVRRNSPWFWAVSDRMHTLYREQDGLAAGVLDYNRYLGY